MGVTQAAGLSLRWFSDQFGAGADDGHDPYKRSTSDAARVPPGADGLLWTPYLMGERTPHLDPNARGALIGLTATHTRDHVIRSILEGVAFSLRDSFTLFEEMGVPVKSIRLGGGGARSALWRQIQADVYGHEVEIVEAEGRGIRRGHPGRSGREGVELRGRRMQCRRARPHRIAPRPAAVRQMNANYAAYRRIYPAVRSVFSSSGISTP